MTERTELINDIEKLKAERNRLLRQVEEAEQWESTAWDSFNALADHLRATEKKQAIAQNYWDSSRRAIESQFEFVASQIARLKKDSYDATFEEKVMRRLNMLEKQQELIYELLLKALNERK